VIKNKIQDRVTIFFFFFFYFQIPRLDYDLSVNGEMLRYTLHRF